MSVSRKTFGVILAGVVAWATLPSFGRSEELKGTIQGVDAKAGTLEVKDDQTVKTAAIRVERATSIKQGD